MSTTNRLIVRGACAHDCPDGCSFISEVENGKVVDFYANPDHPVTQGWLCAKVRPYLDRVYAPDRLEYPFRRSGPKGSNQWERISWDDAISEIATPLDRHHRPIWRRRHPALLLQRHARARRKLVASSRLWNRMGASGLERTICDAAATAACQRDPRR